MAIKKNKKKKWIKFRHRFFRNLLFLFLGTYSRLKYNAKIVPFKEQEKRPYLALMNHQTAHDQFFLGMSFKRPIYFLASEDIFSNGWVSSIIKYLVAPIPIKKQTMDVKAVITCLKVAAEGGSIALAPEGSRTFSGKTEYMNPSIATLARKLNMPICLYRIEGGYGVHPRWSDVVRRGKMLCYVSRVIYPEEYAEMSDEQLALEIKNGLYVNESAPDASFKHKKLAEYLERAIYVCPECGLSTFESHNDILECTICKRKVRYTPDKQFVGVNCEAPFKNVSDWYDFQVDFINGIDTTLDVSAPLYVEKTTLREVIPYKKKLVLCKDAQLSLYGDRLEIAGEGLSLSFKFDETDAITLLGRNKLDIYYNDKIYQLKSGKRFNALKYIHLFHRYKNIVKGEKDGKFLGL